ncbi:Elongation factor 4 [Geodia barretti]|uniref:Translation factor GUF1 homolog, mitochondrial n=1 Tax=Geodia barretti TaxID=519541 RepID=A0AA35RS95_GEOBA|nr:Elongation factor 4 [Geodia barretti]
MEYTGALSEREKTDQFLDKMDLERERGITIKASPVRLKYRSAAGDDYILNLIDTPGHVDFTYEVSRSLAACEGAILVVDAAQGVEAQTVANVYLALDNDLQVLPVINKIDLPSADPERVRQELEDVIGLDGSQAILASAKHGIGTEAVLEGIVANFPPPGGEREKPLRGLIFDSWFDPYHGAVILLRIFEGSVRTGDSIRLMSTGGVFEVSRLGIFAPGPVEVESLGPGEVGFLMAAIKDLHEARMGDTVTLHRRPTQEPLTGFPPLKPMVFSGLYPADSGQYQALRTALEKLSLNDSSFTFEAEASQALGFAFAAGFWVCCTWTLCASGWSGSSPGAHHHGAHRGLSGHHPRGGGAGHRQSGGFPRRGRHRDDRGTVHPGHIHVPRDYLGGVLKLCEEKRGIQQEVRYSGLNRAMVTYELPLNEIMYDFYDRLKSLSRGYASMDYEMVGMRPAKLAKLDVRINGDMVDAMSLIVHRDKAYVRGRDMVQRMRELIPRQLFEVVIQAAIGGRIIARESVKALRKNVTAKCYGGDITRKRKLLEKQKEGKKRMKSVGRVEIPQEAFLAVLKV